MRKWVEHTLTSRLSEKAEEREGEVEALQKQLKQRQSLANQLAVDTERQQKEIDEMYELMEETRKRAEAKMINAETQRVKRELELEESRSKEEEREDEVHTLNQQLKTSRTLTTQLAADTERQQEALRKMQERQETELLKIKRALEESQIRAEARVEEAEMRQMEKEQELEESREEGVSREDEVHTLHRQLKTSRTLTNQLAADMERQQAALKKMQEKMQEAERRAEARMEEAENWQRNKERELGLSKVFNRMRLGPLLQAWNRWTHQVKSIREASRFMHNFLITWMRRYQTYAMRKWVERMLAVRLAEKGAVIEGEVHAMQARMEEDQLRTQAEMEREQAEMELSQRLMKEEALNLAREEADSLREELAQEREVCLRLRMDYPRGQKAVNNFKAIFIRDIAMALEERDGERFEIKMMMSGSIIVMLAIKKSGAEQLKRMLLKQVEDKGSRLYKGEVTQHVTTNEDEEEEAARQAEVYETQLRQIERVRTMAMRRMISRMRYAPLMQAWRTWSEHVKSMSDAARVMRSYLERWTQRYLAYAMRKWAECNVANRLAEKEEEHDDEVLHLQLKLDAKLVGRVVALFKRRLLRGALQKWSKGLKMATAARRLGVALRRAKLSILSSALVIWTMKVRAKSEIVALASTASQQYLARTASVRQRILGSLLSKKHSHRLDNAWAQWHAFLYQLYQQVTRNAPPRRSPTRNPQGARSPPAAPRTSQNSSSARSPNARKPAQARRAPRRSPEKNPPMAVSLDRMLSLDAHAQLALSQVMTKKINQILW
jgi:hypothetical protein